MNILQKIDNAAAYIKSISSDTPEVGLILGSGIGNYTAQTKCKTKIPFGNIPGFAVSSAPGHEGAMYFGKHMGRNILIMSGRLHYYEGYSMQDITFPVRVMNKLGVKRLIITNASGGINTDFKPGTIMLFEDHINLSGDNPLIGKHYEELGARFPDMSTIYAPTLRNNIISESLKYEINLKTGVYAMLTGPSFETPAEIRYLRCIGADAVGMSSVPEAIVASQCGMETVGVSCITNSAAGILEQPLTSQEVFETTNRVKEDIAKVLDISIMTDAVK